MFCSLAIALAVTGLALQLWQHGVFHHAVGGWDAPLGIVLYADGLSLMLLTMTALVGIGCSVYASAYFTVDEAHRFWPLWLFLLAALNALFLSADLFNLYVTLELMGLAVVALTALSGGRDALAGAMRYLLATLSGSLAYLLGVALLYHAFGSVDIATLAGRMTPVSAAWAALGLMSAGLILKTALFPLHLWLPPAHASAPSPVSAVLSALVIKASFYILLRLWIMLFGPFAGDGVAAFLGLLGATAIVWGSVQALRQTRLLLLGTVWLYTLTGTLEFTERGFLHSLDTAHHPVLIAIFFLLIAGLGVKAALVPLHGWLPLAMVAPAPVSELLHAVAVVKAGAFGIVRVVYDVYGVEFAQLLNLLTPLAVVAAVTIIWGSLRALFQNDLKKRLAYSTVSQVSYIALGVALFGPAGTIGGLVHLVHQGIMKITLFFCAGNYAETLGIHKISEMNGTGRRMPLTTLAFSIAALGMMGAPFTAGAVSKVWLMDGAMAADMRWVVWVLWTSSLLNAAYFLPIVFRAWFRQRADAWPDENIPARHWRETVWLLLLPPLVTAVATLVFGIYADTAISPLAWAHLIADREYSKGTP
ncbi:proton-conducting transporter membrane subunit [Sulfuriflexus sp.]|uniref:proton-conducting transporter transmembrane domain-containing protein n=1 Tax=Sulfuriflexus sp. TaxID=2015443 RepID=UPI0028CE490C|nr:proton-conducting transporter membrane subunit [Sulfuriflexus sp.]MDT8403435.1 proton-conducting transporter membrane subunit [Sulfuriflexus sp.]